MSATIREMPEQTTALALTPVDLIRIAVSQNADIDKLSKLMDLQERWEKNEAKKAFVIALGKFKANAPVVIKNKHVKFGNTEYDHATLDAACESVIPKLSEFGFSHSWKVQQPSHDWIRVGCVLTHESTHSEETWLEGPPDTSGSKNAIQAIAAAVTYLQRYSLLAACGLAAKNTDVDGRQTMGDLSEKLEWLENASADKLEPKFREFYKAAKDMKDVAACQALVKAKDARKKELGL